MPFDRETLRFVSLEDFVAMKVFAGSPQDIAEAPRSALEAASVLPDVDLLHRLSLRYGSDTTPIPRRTSLRRQRRLRLGHRVGLAVRTGMGREPEGYNLKVKAAIVRFDYRGRGFPSCVARGQHCRDEPVCLGHQSGE